MADQTNPQNPMGGTTAQNANQPSQMNPYTTNAGTQQPIGSQPVASQQMGQPTPPQPVGGQPMAGQPVPPPPPPPPPAEDNTPANYIIGQHIPKVINVKVPAHSLQFDEQYFLRLLAGSISLTKDEKLRIIESIPRLKQSQIDELIRIFEEEKRKFAELSAKHVDQLKKLEKQHWADWQDIELQQKAVEKKQQEAQQAEEIRKKLGL